MKIYGFDTHQSTVKTCVTCSGVGLHSGEMVNMTISPAKADTGIRFIRKDMNGGAVLPAVDAFVSGTCHATTLSRDNIRVATTEHLMAALAGSGIDNADIFLDGHEVPIMDGSAVPFMDLLRKAGRTPFPEQRKFFRIKRELTYTEGDRSITIQPHDGLRITLGIEFDHPVINSQYKTLDYSEKVFAREIAAARTFGFVDEIDALWANNLALGGSLDNAIVISQHGIINENGLRFSDEFVRHKILDLIGDFALLGWPVLGHIIAKKSGHSQHLGLMQTIRSNPDAWDFVFFPPAAPNKKQHGARQTFPFSPAPHCASLNDPVPVPA